MKRGFCIAVLVAGCASTGTNSVPDHPYPQLVSDRWVGPPPAGAPAMLRGDQAANPERVLKAGAKPLVSSVSSLGAAWTVAERGVRLATTDPPFADLPERSGAGAAGGTVERPVLRLRLAGRRWLPDDEVQGLVSDGGRGVWARTRTGHAHLYPLRMTLEEKARFFEDRVRARHVRLGLVAPCRLSRPGDLTSSETRTDDNDGLWTAMYVAAECFRYAVTGDEEARRFARESYRAIERLQTISGIPGFPARSFLPAGVPTGSGEWHATNDGAWSWKGDTSSDELDGHFFVASVFYDLVADAAEKESIRRNVAAILDHLIGHGYYLVDLDGKPTTWGVWAPEKLNGDPAWFRERGLNSLEILTYLAVGERITGEARFRDASKDLIEKHGYAKNTIGQKLLDPPEEINHSDDELAFLCYYALMRSERDPARLAIYLESLQKSFEAEVLERNPLWTFIALSGGVQEAAHRGPGLVEKIPEPAELLRERAVQTLRDTPMDMVEWGAVHSDRDDLERAPFKNREGRPVALFPLHPLERGNLKYNSDPYSLDDGGGGGGEDDGAFFLLSYWMGRYHGFLSSSRK